MANLHDKSTTSSEIADCLTYLKEFWFLQVGDCRSLIDEGAKALGGKLDVLVNNAGRPRGAPCGSCSGPVDQTWTAIVSGIINDCNVSAVALVALGTLTVVLGAGQCTVQLELLLHVSA